MKKAKSYLSYKLTRQLNLVQLYKLMDKYYLTHQMFTLGVLSNSRCFLSNKYREANLLVRTFYNKYILKYSSIFVLI